MKVSDLTEPLSFILNDTLKTTYPKPAMISSVNNGCRMVALVRPDVSTEVGIVTLAEGTKQALPEDAVRLLDTCYLIKDSKPVTPVELVMRSDLDRLVPKWQQQDNSDTVTEVMYDERCPDVFWCNPPSKAGVELQMSYAVMPPIITDYEDKFPLSPKYVPVVMEWVLYLMFSRDSENSMNQQRAADHRNQFYLMLNIKTQSDKEVSPMGDEVSVRNV